MQYSCCGTARNSCRATANSQFGFKERRPDPSGIPFPDAPAARIKKGLQADATTCGDPGRVDCSGFIFMAVNSSVSQLSNAFLFALALQSLQCSEPNPSKEGALPKCKKAGTEPRLNKQTIDPRLEETLLGRTARVSSLVHCSRRIDQQPPRTMS